MEEVYYASSGIPRRMKKVCAFSKHNFQFSIFNFQFPILAQREAGFSLFEVLVAMVILAMTLVSVFGLFSGGLQAARLVKDYTQAVIYARQKQEELTLSPSLSPDFKSGIFEDSNYRWEVKIAPYTGRGWPKEDPDLPHLFRIQVKVAWPGPKMERTYELVTLKMVPREEEGFGAPSSSGASSIHPVGSPPPSKGSPQEGAGQKGKTSAGKGKGTSSLGRMGSKQRMGR